jgi:hypothetical protein
MESSRPQIPAQHHKSSHSIYEPRCPWHISLLRLIVLNPFYLIYPLPSINKYLSPLLLFFETCGRYRVSVFNYISEELENEIKSDLETAQGLIDQ